MSMICYFSRLKKTLESIAALIDAKFEVLIERNITKFLGMIIEQDPRRMFIKIRSWSLIDQILETFECSNCKQTGIPLPTGTVLSKSMAAFGEREEEKMNSVLYRQLVGSILQLSNTTRPDLAFMEGYLSKFMSNPGMEHWKTAKNVL